MPLFLFCVAAKAGVDTDLTVVAAFDGNLRNCRQLYEYLDDSKQTALVAGIVSSLMGKNVTASGLGDIDIAYCDEIKSGSDNEDSEDSEDSEENEENDVSAGSVTAQAAKKPMSFQLELSFSVSNLYPNEAKQVASVPAYFVFCFSLWLHA